MNKPIIRHCENCEWARTFKKANPWCCVRHNERFHPRLSGLFCRFFKKGEVEDD